MIPDYEGPKKVPSEAEKITQFGEKLALGSGGRERDSVNDTGLAGGERDVFQTVGIAQIEGRAGVQKPGQQHISRESLLPVETDEGRVFENRIVVRYQPERELAVELIIEARADDMVEKTVVPGFVASFV